MRAARLAAFALTVLLVEGGVCAQQKLLRPGRTVDYSKLAFYPERWREQGVDTRMTCWRGEHVALLTPRVELDRRLVTLAVERLDAGWQVYADLTGRQPTPFRMAARRPVIAAVPSHTLTCGYGCGYVGSTGIELAGFLDRDLDLLRADPAAAPHYWFYEQGRNFYTFGERHSLFVTGFAVFMRYVCMDALGAADPDLATRRVIERCEELYASSDLPFLDAFTNLGEGEKSHRLKDAEGRQVTPSDQPCIYAGAMLALRRDHGGDEWLRRFYRHLARLPELPATDREGALRQCRGWLVCASAAAGEDLSPTFCDRWRMPIDDATREALAAVDWTDEKLDVGALGRLLGRRTDR